MTIHYWHKGVYYAIVFISCFFYSLILLKITFTKVLEVINFFFFFFFFYLRTGVYWTRGTFRDGDIYYTKAKIFK